MPRRSQLLVIALALSGCKAMNIFKCIKQTCCQKNADHTRRSKSVGHEQYYMNGEGDAKGRLVSCHSILDKMNTDPCGFVDEYSCVQMGVCKKPLYLDVGKKMCSCYKTTCAENRPTPKPTSPPTFSAADTAKVKHTVYTPFPTPRPSRGPTTSTKGHLGGSNVHSSVIGGVGHVINPNFRRQRAMQLSNKIANGGGVQGGAPASAPGFVPFMGQQTAQDLHVPLPLVKQGLKVKSIPPASGCHGPRARNGDKTKILLTAYLYDTVKKSKYHSFPALRQRELYLTLGLGHAIEGLDGGIVGMCAGETRDLMIPPSLAYGARVLKPCVNHPAPGILLPACFGDYVPADSTLWFEVTLAGFGF